MSKTNTKWKAQHESGSVVDVQIGDARKLFFMKECGYEMVDIGGGWRPIEFVAVELEWTEEVKKLQDLLDGKL